VIAIVYGARSDWLKNVLRRGAAAIVHRGATYRVDDPEFVPMQGARAYFPAALQRIHRRLRIDRCLRVRRSEVVRTSARTDQDQSLVRTKGGHDEAAERKPGDPVPEEQALHGGGDSFHPQQTDDARLARS
jgi:hypothetical protein